MPVRSYRRRCVVAILISFQTRARHVKCDETPGSCKRCKDSGWRCEGYDDVRLSNLKREDRTTPSSLTLHRLSNGPGISPEEKRGFVFFEKLTVPNLTGFFDTRIWTELVLPLSHEDRAVTHAVLAVSVLHEDSEIRGTPLSRENLNIQRHRFALVQYGRSMAILNERRYSQDPKLREVILVCCLLFVMSDLLRGQYSLALLHVKQGIAIVEESARMENHESFTTKSPVMVKRCLATALMRLSTQCFYFGLEPVMLNVGIEGPNPAYGFPTLYEARNALESAVAPLTVLLSAQKELPSEEFRNDRFSALQKLQEDTRLRFAQFRERLDYSESNSMCLKTEKDLRGLKIIRLHCLNYQIVLETALCPDERESLTPFIDTFREMLVLCKQIMVSFEESGDQRPTVILDMGVNAPLFYICWKCPVLMLRLEALKLLEIWPHREGPWDSRLLVSFANNLLKLECEYSPSLNNHLSISSLDISNFQVARRVLLDEP